MPPWMNRVTTLNTPKHHIHSCIDFPYARVPFLSWFSRRTLSGEYMGKMHRGIYHCQGTSASSWQRAHAPHSFSFSLPFHGIGHSLALERLDRPGLTGLEGFALIKAQTATKRKQRDIALVWQTQNRNKRTSHLQVLLMTDRPNYR